MDTQDSDLNGTFDVLCDEKWTLTQKIKSLVESQELVDTWDKPQPLKDPTGWLVDTVMRDMFAEAVMLDVAQTLSRPALDQLIKDLEDVRDASV